MAFVVLYDACVLYPAPLRARRRHPGWRAGCRDVNLDDFPTARLEPYNIEAKHPDDFVIDTIDLSPGVVATVVAEQAAALRNPPRSVAQLLNTSRDQGLVRSVAKLRELFAVGDL